MKNTRLKCVLLQTNAKGSLVDVSVWEKHEEKKESLNSKKKRNEQQNMFNYNFLSINFAIKSV